MIKVNLHTLFDPLGGMVTGATCHRHLADESKVFVQAISFSVPPSGISDGSEDLPVVTTKASSGSGATKEDALFLALAEMLERHASYSLDNNRVFKASPNELGSYALDLNLLPRCSFEELQSSKCYAVKPELAKPMRWVDGVSLLTGKHRALPIGTVYLCGSVLETHERVQAPISTGLAAHQTLSDAIVSGILEVIERDALSLMWLQMMPGQKLNVNYPLDKSNTGMRYHFLDITTDVGIPVICCIRRAPESKRMHTLVSCAAGFNQADLIDKAIRDTVAQGIGFRKDRQVPSNFLDFTAVHHGATFMAHHNRAPAFEFLLTRSEKALGVLSDSEMAKSNSSEQQLSGLLDRLRNSGFEAFVVDLTSVEATAVGMRVVRVIIPGLQPLPYRYATRYLAHPRLYNAPARMGYHVRSEREINEWPLPFA